MKLMLQQLESLLFFPLSLVDFKFDGGCGCCWCRCWYMIWRCWLSPALRFELPFMVYIRRPITDYVTLTKRRPSPGQVLLFEFYFSILKFMTLYLYIVYQLWRNRHSRHSAEEQITQVKVNMWSVCVLFFSLSDSYTSIHRLLHTNSRSERQFYFERFMSHFD